MNDIFLLIVDAIYNVVMLIKVFPFRNGDEKIINYMWGRMVLIFS